MTMTEEMLKLITEELETFAALGSGYRAILERAGFSSTASEQLAAAFLAEYQASVIRGMAR